MEVVPHVGDQLGVARVVQGLDAKDLRRERVVVLVLARSEEVLDTQDDAGNRAESAGRIVPSIAAISP